MKSPTGCARALSADTIAAIFDRCFLASDNTRLCGAAAEPLYEPATGDAPALIHFREDYAASALHEAAHWCIAGPERRQQVDYGYWYAADGRGEAQQRLFMRVEARPQALEWCFSQAAGLRFRLSLDNLDAPPDPTTERLFGDAVLQAALRLRSVGLPPRAEQFLGALARRFRPGFRRDDLVFSRDQLC